MAHDRWPDDRWWWRYGGWILALPLTMPFMAVEVVLDEWRCRRSWRRWEREYGCPATFENLIRIEVEPRLQEERQRLRAEGYGA